MNTRNLSTKKPHNSFLATADYATLTRADGQPDEEAVITDAVVDSHDALLLTEALHVAQNTPDVRVEKVESLRAQIEAGTYEIDNFQLACALLREEPHLFRA